MNLPFHTTGPRPMETDEVAEAGNIGRLKLEKSEKPENTSSDRVKFLDVLVVNHIGE